MKRSVPALLALTIFLAGCSNSTGLAPSVSQSGFDGARVVDIEPHGNACASMICTGLGAQWSSTKPDIVFLKVKIFNEYKGIAGAKLNIDGQIYDLKPVNQANSFNADGGVMATTEMVFITTPDVVRKITLSKRTWLRVITTTGTIEDPVIDGSQDSKAYYALQRFVAEMDKK
ncbi:TPA: hypothetical protein ACIUKL_002079 [Salmonella enterica subsp. enterica serovar 4,5,12:b:-]|uniref:Lipoprotein n=3 Tax=Salmonella enterica I TaxID=59201 RepID=A0A738YNU2_SALET|nr:hypothetical protein [Salmonella enterica]ECF4502123.1 hypothetical protein [Salmonella enterica subsp. enterica serovar Javiana]ECI4854978.1 hypothetical protein [Salmonella enterica subsp. enterica]EGI6247628.1 hypothetical protein [Salmonella enterica subsp. enterica serovar Orientalis]EKQ9749702.1 hypothetical protein [Salmonella enterica subsp. enterica serovar 4,[5],12:b:-]QVP99601.1 hypothetical protein CAI54_21980 [Salmonella enterica subsp. enterica serovar Paratyphi B str. CFSAN00